ncbi:MAG TPA: hypothetical protein VL527_05430 [Dongiaceae bacterium]|nr:hypothetical protein [Dongiaceae bacterium]
MGWGRMLLLGNVGQQLDIGDLERTINDMHGAVADNEQVDEQQARSIEQLQRENRELKLYLATLVKLLVGKGVLRPEEVEVAVQAIEAKA